MVLDAFGVTAEGGLKVAFGKAQRGAQPLSLGTIVSIGPKTVRIRAVYERLHWQSREPVEVVEHHQRPNGAFVVQL
ncbi:MAG: hypothetical protein [Caudoviricetes sp.]|nr:MAG: hypothetical protein [Caudoviricetes sp.]